MRIASDWHIHSRNSCDSASLPIARLIADAADMGIVDYGVTDHIHTPYNMPDLDASHAEYESCCPTARFHFGVEASVVSAWEIAEVATGRYDTPTYGLRSGGPANAPLALGITKKDIDRLGIEFVVGGTHWPMYIPYEREQIIRDYHRQNMYLATHPLVTIVAHPWWWHGAWEDADGMFRTDPWLADFGVIPMSMHDEFAAAARENGKVVEANISAMLLNPTYPERFKRQYAEYISMLAERGVSISIGSDCHDPEYSVIDFATTGAHTGGVGSQGFPSLVARPARD